jgi:phosphatidate cytidylyltransferase
MAALLAFMLVVFGRQMFQKTRDLLPLETMAYTVFGLFYVVWLFSFVTKIVYLLPRSADHHVTGHFYVLWLILVTKFSDMGAYVTGSLIGKHPLVPHISPKKTWEGFFGALAFSIGGGCGLLAMLPAQLSFLNYTHAVVLGLVLGFAAIVGDLAESLHQAKLRSEGLRQLAARASAERSISSTRFYSPRRCCFSTCGL